VFGSSWRIPSCGGSKLLSTTIFQSENTMFGRKNKLIDALLVSVCNNDVATIHQSQHQLTSTENNVMSML